MHVPERQIDVVVVGGGVVGAAILREIARYDASVALIEARPDLCDATSKANSGIVHTGFDAPPGSLEARLLAEARALWPATIEALRIPYLQTGAMMVATSEAELRAIEEEIIPKATRNGVALQRLGRDEIRDSAPAVTPDARGGVLVEGEGVIDPFWTVRAYAESAVRNGAEVLLGQAVTRLEVERARVRVETSGGLRIAARAIVNAAGLWADEVARLAGDASFRLTPRKGQFLLTEDDLGVGQIILPVPSRVSKGILVTPVVFGGTLLGPTAEDVADKSDLATTAAGLAAIREGASRLVPGARGASSIRQFAGLRAVSSTGDYIIRPSATSPRLIHVAGIRSTGLSASPAIGRYVAGLVRDALGLSPRVSFEETLPEFLTEARPGEGDVVCLCRAITRGEILAALRSDLPPTTLDGLKRRTGAMLGDCQGNLCLPRIVDLFAERLNRDPLALDKHAAGSAPVVGRIEGEA